MSTPSREEDTSCDKEESENCEAEDNCDGAEIELLDACGEDDWRYRFGVGLLEGILEVDWSCAVHRRA